jgi:class 3 adenylate cyclase
MEKELNPGDIHREAPGSSIAESPRLELAHVLFMDLVAYSTMPMEEQRQSLHSLQEIVRQSQQPRDGERDGGLIRLPTGDGMALVFFGDPIVCVQCALDVSARLKDSPLKLRMGVNTGPVYRVADINTNLNAAGGGINTAQRRRPVRTGLEPTPRGRAECQTFTTRAFGGLPAS